ncbi:hypothetical protein [Synechococcus sp. RS9907]|uniref:hypothetical protein n=1 Tax=Synechococcus sp. RS9907 TaxID=221350 RepID=UPI00165EB9E1|nr:hypothetical protein [Synechococcus sp. RS9907]
MASAQRPASAGGWVLSHHPVGTPHLQPGHAIPSEHRQGERLIGLGTLQGTHSSTRWNPQP